MCVEEQRRQNLVAEDHNQHHDQNGLRNLRVGRRAPHVGARSNSTAPNAKRDDAKRKLLQHRRRQRRMFAAQADMRLDLLLPRVEIVLHLARQNLAELGVHAADVRGQRIDQSPQ